MNSMGYQTFLEIKINKFITKILEAALSLITLTGISTYDLATFSLKIKI